MAQGPSFGGQDILLSLRSRIEHECDAVWSPCGTRVAISQYIGWHPRPYTLTIWNLATGNVQVLAKVPFCHDLHMAWVSGTSWLVWVESSPGADQRHSCQRWRCLDAVTKEEHAVSGQPFEDMRIIRAVGRASLMACVDNLSVVLLTLPDLKPAGTLRSDRRVVLDMQFDFTASHIAITWGSQDLGHQGGSACGGRVDVFSTGTHTSCFRMLSHDVGSEVQWSPASAHLLILSDHRVHMLGLTPLKCTAVPIRASPDDAAFGWVANGSMAIVEGVGARDCYYTATHEYFAILPDGTVGFTFVYTEHGPVFPIGHDKSPIALQGPLSNFRFHRASKAGLELETQDILDRSPVPIKLSMWSMRHFSICQRSIVTKPLQSQHGWVSAPIQLDLDFEAHTVRECRVPCGPVPASAFDFMKAWAIWHPSPMVSKVYALAGRGHDLWLIDGQQHKVLHHWQGKDLLKCAHIKDAAVLETNSTWQRGTWSHSGASLLMVGKWAIIAIDFGSAGPCKPGVQASWAPA